MSQCPQHDEDDFIDVILPIDVAQTMLVLARQKPNPTPEEREAMTVTGFQIEQAVAKEKSHEAED